MKLLEQISLKEGAHKSSEDGMCAMEAIAWYMDETHSDQPECVSPVIASAMRMANGRISDTTARNKILKPLLLEVIGTNTGQDDDMKRAFIAADYAVRVFAPLRLDVAHPRLAEVLRALPEIVDKQTADAVNAAADAAAWVEFRHMILDMCKAGL